tara:strand:- start:1077 stop:1232 length:156 start_codon:yes stop_codon:yes gene_type:complete
VRSSLILGGQDCPFDLNGGEAVAEKRAVYFKDMTATPYQKGPVLLSVFTTI